MKTKVNMRLVTGDENLVRADEVYVAMDANSNITALKKRDDSGMLKTLVDEPVALEDKKTATKSLASLKEGDKITITPSTGKDGMKKVEITITA